MNPATPPHLAVDADGFVWQVYGPDIWSIARGNPDNSAIPKPVTYYAPMACPGCSANIPPKLVACEDCQAQANVDPDNEGWAWR